MFHSSSQIYTIMHLLFVCKSRSFCQSQNIHSTCFTTLLNTEIKTPISIFQIQARSTSHDSLAMMIMTHLIHRSSFTLWYIFAAHLCALMYVYIYIYICVCVCVCIYLKTLSLALQTKLTFSKQTTPTTTTTATTTTKIEQFIFCHEVHHYVCRCCSS